MRNRIAIGLIAALCVGLAVPAHSQNTGAFFDGTVWFAEPSFTDLAPGDSVSGSYALPPAPSSTLPFPIGNLHFIDVVGGVDFDLELGGVDAVLDSGPGVAVFTGDVGFDLWQLLGNFSHDLVYPAPGQGFRCFIVAGIVTGEPPELDYYVYDGSQGIFTLFTHLVCQVFDLTDPFLPGVDVLRAVVSLGSLQARIAAPPVSECTSPAGAVVRLDGSSSLAPAGTSFSWVDEANGQNVGVDAVIDVHAPIGSTTYTLTITAGDSTDSTSVSVLVRDTVAPDVTADLVPAGNGHNYSVVVNATDVCDADVDVEASIGATVFNGSTATIARPEETGTLRLEGEGLRLHATGTDDAGNEGEATATP